MQFFRNFFDNPITKKYGFLIATIITLFVNGLATVGNLGGLSTKQISDIFFTILTPAGFTFSIWSIIYSSLLVISGLVIAQKVKISSKGLAYYFLSCLSNCIWIFLWQFLFPVPAAFLLFSLVFFNALTYLELKKSNQGAMMLGITSAYLIYLGWSIVASAINFTVVLQYILKFNGFGIDAGLWGVFVLYVAMLINVIISIREQNPTTALVLFWATFGIANAQDNKILLGGVGSVYTILILISVQALREYYLHKQLKKTN